MEKSTKRKLLIGFSVAILLGVGAYFVVKAIKKKKEEKLKEKADAKAKADADASATSSSKDSGSSGSSTGGGSVSIFKTQAEGDAFRKWVNQKYPAYAKKNSLDLTGSISNAYIRNAWNTYGEEYSKSNAPKPTWESSGSGFAVNDSLFPVYITDTAYSYPSTEERYRVGRVNQSGAKSVGRFIKNSSTKGWIFARVVVQGYKWDDATKSYPSSIQDVYLQAKNYTNKGV